MKIAILIHSMHTGGAERVVANLANAWAKKGWEVHLITMAPIEGDFYRLQPEVVRYTCDMAKFSSSCLQAVLHNFKRVFMIRKYLKKVQPDIALGMMTTASILLVIAGYGLRCRLIISERIYPPLYSVGRIRNWLRRLVYPLADYVVMLTSEGREWLSTRIPNAKGVVIPNPVSYPVPATDPVLLPENVVSAERKLLLAVGRLDEQKQFDALLEVFATLVLRYPDWDLVILGEGPKRNMLEHQVGRLGIGMRAFLPGRVGNIGDWYSRADLYVMTSRFEGFPNTLAEAMAYGCPAVSYDCDTGPRDIIRDGLDGLLVNPVGDIEKLGCAIEQLMSNDTLRHTMATKAVDVRSRFSIHNIMAMWDEIILAPGVGK